MIVIVVVVVLVVVVVVRLGLGAVLLKNEEKCPRRPRPAVRPNIRGLL